MRVAFIENNDSFSFNVIDALPVPRGEVKVFSCSEFLRSLDSARDERGGARDERGGARDERGGARDERCDVVVLGPGPMDPLRAGLLPLVEVCARERRPLLGICLGHQALGLAFGAQLVRGTPTHGKRAVAHFVPSRTLPGVDGDFTVMRYHSLAVTDVKAPLRVIASLADGTVMAVEHETLPMTGLQFHPDSFGTPHGRELLQAWFAHL